jgi:UDP-glucose 4,6-dehydratase
MDSLQGKNVLITGACGFIASNVLIYLSNKYSDINFINFDILDYCASLENLLEIENNANYKFIKGDICSEDLVNYVMMSEKIDVVMHFAANSHVCNSFLDPIKFTKTNVLGTHILLEAARKNCVKLFIHVSTDEIYGEDLNDTPMNETQRMNPSNPYASSKAAAELMAMSYYHSFGLPVIISRCNNVYGRHQFIEKMIPKFICQLLRGLPITIHGTGENLRNFLFIDDVSRAFETLLFNGKIGEIYNIGGSNEYSNIKIARKLISLMDIDNTDDKMITFVKDRKFNDFRYNITSDKIKALGWVEECSFDYGITNTIEWYKNNKSRFDNQTNFLSAHPV